MPKIINSEKKPIKLWLDDIDNDTLSQAKNLANLPFLFHHVALMPDAHVGYGMPIGGVAAMDGMVIPNGVGVDIGCGVAAVETSCSITEEKTLKRLLKEIRVKIPLGFKHHKLPQPHELMPGFPENKKENDLPVVSREYENGRTQIGTLGGGNHFIEVQISASGKIWLMVHSGSRNLGYQVAHHYNRIAAELNKKAGAKIPPKWQLDPLPVNSATGQKYLSEMGYCVRFAAASRKFMIQTIMDMFSDLEPATTYADIIDIAHNYAAREKHFGKEVYVHRKGATRAEAGQTGIIPGSQGSSSYIVRGLGNRESFSSCSHGAGRKLGRKQAQRKLDLQTEIEKLNRLGVLHAIRHKKDLDEAAGAYKDIEKVIDSQRDLIEIVEILKPLAVIKG